MAQESSIDMMLACLLECAMHPRQCYIEVSFRFLCKKIFFFPCIEWNYDDDGCGGEGDALLAMVASLLMACWTCRMTPGRCALPSVNSGLRSAYHVE